MRLRITLDDDVVADLDRRVGPRRRSSFITAAVRQALQDPQSWVDLEASVGAVEDGGHDWDDNRAAWVRVQRQA